MTYNAPGKPACHQRKPHEQEQPRPPHEPRVPAKRTFTHEPFLIDHVHHQQAQRGDDAGNPVWEGDVHGDGVVWCVPGRVGVCGDDGGVPEDPVREGELGGWIDVYVRACVRACVRGRL